MTGPLLTRRAGEAEAAGKAAGTVQRVPLLAGRAGKAPQVLTASALAGVERATELFEAAYDEHARRLAKLYERIGSKDRA